MKCIEYVKARTKVLLSYEYGYCCSQSTLQRGCHLDDITLMAILCKCCAFGRMEVQMRAGTLTNG